MDSRKKFQNIFFDKQEKTYVEGIIILILE
jgi:hypothetical protein